MSMPQVHIVPLCIDSGFGLAVGTEILSYSTVFGLTELEVKNYLKQMLAEEVENSELSVSSFLVAEKDGVVAAALSAWIEGFGGMSSSMLKGNLLTYFLPKQCFERAAKINNVIRDKCNMPVYYQFRLELVMLLRNSEETDY